MASEDDHVKRRHGKWSQAGLPHTGWSCVDIEDLLSPSMTCQMCESSEIRYAHHMRHPNHPEMLICGCVCAGHMEGEMAAARERESSMKSRAGKRKRWLSRRWKVSRKGNPYIEADGYRITVYPQGAGWGASVAKLGTENVIFSRRTTLQVEQAKIAAFDLVTRLLSPGAGFR